MWIWVVPVGGLALLIAAVLWKRRARRVYVINHVRVEMHPECVVEDRVIEQVWRAAISMTNTSRRPRELPVFGERATVRAGRRNYLAVAYLDSDAVETNPDDVALAWLEFVLPEDSTCRQVDLVELRAGRALKFRPTRSSNDVNRRLSWARFDRSRALV